jgi:cytochrome c peroxidase
MRKTIYIRGALSILVGTMLVGCNDNSENIYYPENIDNIDPIDTTENIDTKLSTLIAEHALSGDPSTGKELPKISDAKAQLGMKLFFTKSLGGNTDSACVTCHHPVLGGGDNLSLSIGVDAVNEYLLGIGREHDPLAVNYDQGYAPVPRNAPTTFNLALWDKELFWDSRVESLNPDGEDNGATGGISTPDSGFLVEDPNAGANLAVAQARFPVTSQEEMRGFTFEADNSNADVRTHLGTRLNDSTSIDYIANTWQDEFDATYGSNSVTFDNIVDAMGEYERSQIFVDSPWKAYVQGDLNALTEVEKRGAQLFFSSYEEGGMNCVNCHSGDFFTDETPHVMAIPQVGQGKGNGIEDDFGRANTTGTDGDKYKFRTPTLLNVEVTGPWGHDGAYTTLDAMVAHMINPDKSVENYDLMQLDANVKVDHTIENTNYALAQLNANRVSGVSTHQNVDATEAEIQEIVAFLKTLTDPCVKDRSCIGKWIPENVSGPDGLQLNAEDENGNLL